MADFQDPPIRASLHLSNGSINPIWQRWFLDVKRKISSTKTITVVTGVNFVAQTVTTETIEYVEG